MKPSARDVEMAHELAVEIADEFVFGVLDRKDIKRRIQEHALEFRAQAREEGRLEGLEEAVKVVYDIPTMFSTSRKDIATRIRALAKGGEP